MESEWKSDEIDPNLKDNILDKSVIQFSPASELLKTNELSLIWGKKFRICKRRVKKDLFIQIRFGDSFNLQEVESGKYLGCNIHGKARLEEYEIDENEEPCLFQFFKESKIIEGNREEDEIS